MALTICDDLVARLALDMGGEAYTAGILLELWVIETLLEREGARPRFVLGRVLVLIYVHRLLFNLVDGALVYIVGEGDSTHSFGVKPNGPSMGGGADRYGRSLGGYRGRGRFWVCSRWQNGWTRQMSVTGSRGDDNGDGEGLQAREESDRAQGGDRRRFSHDSTQLGVARAPGWGMHEKLSLVALGWSPW